MATAKKDKAAQAYEVVSPLNHDQVDYEVGSTVELTEEQAASLLGHTVKAPDAKTKANAKAETAST
jgi:hypothetical protein